MILRRLANAVREQNWFTVFIEFTLVVAGVLVALQFDNWNEERLQDKQQKVYLERLHNDFIAINERIEEHFGVYQKGIDGGNYLLTILRANDTEFAGLQIDDAKVRSALAWVDVARIPPPLPATYTEMLADGQLSNLDSHALRDKLAEYARLLSILEELSRVTVMTIDGQTPIVSRHFDSDTVPDETNLAGIKREILNYNIEGMRSDREFSIAVRFLKRVTLNTLEQRRIQKKLIREILAIIEQERTS